MQYMSIKHLRQFIRHKRCHQTVLAYAHSPPILPFLHPQYLRLESTTASSHIDYKPFHLGDRLTLGCLAEYWRMREEPSFRLEDIPFSDYKRAVRQAARGRSTGLLDEFGTDILNAQDSSFQRRAQCAYALFDEGVRHHSLSDKLKADLTLFLVENATKFDTIPPKYIGLCAGIIADLELEGKINSNSPLLQAINPYLLSAQPSDSTEFVAQDVWDGLPSEPFYHKPYTWILFRHVLGYLKKGDLPATLSLYNSLMETRRLAPEAIRRTESDVDPKNVALVIVSVLLRSCLVWGWRIRSNDLFRYLLFSLGQTVEGPSSRSIPQNVLIALDSINVLLKAVQDPEHLSQCAKWICDVSSLRLPAELIDPLALQLYEKAFRMNFPEAAYQIYKALSSSGGERSILYRSPPSATLYWFLSYLLGSLHDMHLARILTNDIIRKEAHIDECILPQLLKLLATRNLGDEVKTLWLRYAGFEPSKLPEKYIARCHRNICSSPTVMLALVKYFVRQAEKLEHRLKKERTNAELGLHRPFIPYNQLDEKDLDPEEMYRFARLVMKKYEEAWQPLESANKIALNALSRAYFIVGEIDKGINTMRMVLLKHVVLGWQDLSVTLASMARLDPRRAARMLQRMIDKGISPTLGDFGAIIHAASLRGDDALVGAVTAKLRELGHDQLSTKGLHSLIRTTIRFPKARPGERPDEPVQTMIRVLRMIKALKDSGDEIISTPWMGNQCADSCLRVNQGKLAYEFWRLLVKDKEDWDIHSQKALRNRIVHALIQDMEARVIPRPRAQIMIDDLKGRFRTQEGSADSAR